MKVIVIATSKILSGLQSRSTMAGGVLCDSCGERRAAMRRPKTLERFCRVCFVKVFEDEVHRTIVEHRLFR